MTEKELRKKIAEYLLKARKIVAEHKAEYSGFYKLSGGGGTTSSNTTTTIPPEVLAEYQQVTGQANQVAAAPLQQYQGQIVAPTNATENTAYNSINNMQGITAPYTGAASGLVSQATQNINPNTVTAAQIQQYESPYTQQVLNSTVAEENNQDAQQQAQLQGNAISSGAWGGDRSAVAQGILGGQQALANNATNAGILNTGYTQAEQEANTQQQAELNAQQASQYLQLSGGALQNQLGITAQQEGLTGAGAQLNAGQLQQQQTQSELNVPYEQFLQQQAYPFQTTGWLGNIAEGLGSNEGGQSTSSTSQPSEGLFSDRRLKDDIKDAGILRGKRGEYPLHTFKYKGSGITQAGVIAQEVEKKNPDAVGIRQGYKTVDYSKLARGGIVPHRDAGGVTPFDQSINPVQNNITNNYSQMSLQQLQQLAQRLPPGTPQGQAVQAALKQKQFMPNVTSGMARGGIIPHFNNGGGQGGGADRDFAMQVPNLQGPENSYTIFGDNAPSSGASNANPESLPTPTPPVNAPDHPANSGSYETEMPKPHEANPWLSVAAGVLGTLAGRSRNPLVDIGQGGLIGLNNYAGQVKTADEQNYQEGSFHQNAQKLMDERDQAQQKFAQEKQNEADVQQYRQGQLAHEQAALQQNQNEVIKDMFGQPTGTFNKSTGKFAPITNADGTPVAAGAGSIKDVDGTPLQPWQAKSFMKTMATNQPKDITAEQGVLSSLYDQTQKVNDLAKQIPIASSGDIHTLADFADRNQIPVFSDPVRGAATAAAAYDNMGNVLDSIRPTFSGTGRVLKSEFDALKNELSAAANYSPEQKAMVVGKIQSKLNDLTPLQEQYAEDIQSGKAYLPSYKSPVQQRLLARTTASGNPTSAGTTAPSSIIRYDANGNRIQ